MYKEIVVLFLLYLCVSLPSFAYENSPQSQAKVYLTIVSPSAWSMGFLGHAFISFQKPNQPIMFSQTYNYNKLYDANDKIQVAKNLAGKIPLELEVLPFFHLFKLYAQIENRNIFLLELNLTANETEKLQFLLESDRNKLFPYSSNSNCVTKIVEHLNSSVADNKKIPFDPKETSIHFGFKLLYSKQDEMISRFPIMLMQILDRHPILKSKQILDSSNIKLARTLLGLQKKLQSYSLQCGWSNSTLFIIQNNFLAAIKRPDQLDEYLIPYAKFVRTCISYVDLKGDFLSLLEAVPSPNNDSITRLYKGLEVLYAQ